MRGIEAVGSSGWRGVSKEGRRNLKRNISTKGKLRHGQLRLTGGYNHHGGSWSAEGTGREGRLGAGQTLDKMRGRGVCKKRSISEQDKRLIKRKAVQSSGYPWLMPGADSAIETADDYQSNSISTNVAPRQHWCKT